MEGVWGMAEGLGSLPDPGQAGGLGELVERLRVLKRWAGDPSYEAITAQVNRTWTAAGRPAGELTRKSTVADCFRPGRRRLNIDLALAVVEVLNPDSGYVAQWRQAFRVIAGEVEAASQVRVGDALPTDLAEFSGRRVELDRLSGIVAAAGRERATVVTIEGMAGVGKTQFAVHAGHLLADHFEQVLFVNLRGFHPDPSRPPADPAAVLDGFLRLLGVPGHQIPHSVEARSELYRERLADRRALVLLDNAVDAEQVRPLLPETSGSLTLVSSRRDLSFLDATRFVLGVFSPEEATAFLTGAVANGDDSKAVERIAARCGYLPLALGLVAGYILATADWSLSDHADRLDERNRDRRLESEVEVALDLSYHRLPAEQRRLLRLASQHPGQELESYGAAALTGTDLATSESDLRALHRDHLLQLVTPGRYAFHDLVRAFAHHKAVDEERPTERRSALTRLFDYYLFTTATATNLLFPHLAARRPRIAQPTTPVPPVEDDGSAGGWLGAERSTLMAIALHAAANGWPSYTTRLSILLQTYLDSVDAGGALAIHQQAYEAAELVGDPMTNAQARVSLGSTYRSVGQYERATELLLEAAPYFREAGDQIGEAGAYNQLGVVEKRLGRYESAVEYLKRALVLFEEAGEKNGQASVLNNLGVIEDGLGRSEEAADYLEQALALYRQTGLAGGEVNALNDLGEIEGRLGRYEEAERHLRDAIELCRGIGYRIGEASTLDSLGTLHTKMGRADEATAYHGDSLVIFRELGERDGECWALMGLGDAALLDGRATDALVHHGAAQEVAAAIAAADHQARAHAGLGHSHRMLGDPERARQHYDRAVAIYADIGRPEVAEVRAALVALDGG